MKRVSLVLLLPVVLLSCDKSNSSQQTVCACDKPLIGGLRLTGWDGTSDTADVYVYNTADSFTTVIGSMTNKPVQDNGTVSFYISPDTARKYKIVFRQSGKEYLLDNIAANSDSAGCSSINNQLHCFSQFTYMLNGSADTATKAFDDYLIYDGYKIPVEY